MHQVHLPNNAVVLAPNRTAAQFPILSVLCALHALRNRTVRSPTNSFNCRDSIIQQYEDTSVH